MIETDCEVDFAPPLDYVEPDRAEPPQASVPEPAANGEICNPVLLPPCLADVDASALLSACHPVSPMSTSFAFQS